MKNVLEYNLGKLNILDKNELIDLIKNIELAIYIHNNNCTEQLENIKEYGPVYCGSLISKKDEKILREEGLVIRTYYKGESGYSTCTQKGSRILEIIKLIYPEKDSINMNLYVRPHVYVRLWDEFVESATS